MLNKVISSIILVCSFIVLPLSQTHPNSLLFLFISPSKVSGAFRLALTLLIFFASFGLFAKHFSARSLLHRAFLKLGIILIAFGLLSALETSLGSIFYDYLKPLDIMIVLEAGIVLVSMSLLPQPAQATAAPAKARTPKAKAKKATPHWQHAHAFFSSFMTHSSSGRT